jgi:hypothetical protein
MDLFSFWNSIQKFSDFLYFLKMFQRPTGLGVNFAVTAIRCAFSPLMQHMLLRKGAVTGACLVHILGCTLSPLLDWSSGCVPAL